MLILPLYGRLFIVRLGYTSDIIIDKWKGKLEIIYQLQQEQRHANVQHSASEGI